MKIITVEMDAIDLRLACHGYYHGDVCKASVKELVKFYEGLTFCKNGEEWKVSVLMK